MNIGIDARLLHNATGIGRYTRSLFFELMTRQPANDVYYLLYDRPFPGLPYDTAKTAEHDAPAAISGNLPAHVRMLVAPCTTRILWTNLYVPQLLKRHQIDVYHGVCNFELPLRKVCRYVVTIHDLVPLFFPRVVPWKHRLFFRLFMRPAARTADIILTDSYHSQHDIARYLRVPREKIRVTYLGYTPRHIDAHQDTAGVLETYGITRPYLLFVGIQEPKKNLERLLEAFALLLRMPSINPQLQLVVAGGKGWLYDNLSQHARDLGIGEQVVFTGFVPDDHLPALYHDAEAFVFPSLYEGFGLPVLEAMTYGVPVVTSQASSLPEIAGDAAVLVNPHSSEAIRDGIAEVLLNPQKADEMRKKGREQARKFSWKRTAEETYAAYQDAYAL
jgi:glycosyltransferase involved in cell wall biosynthesis